MAELKPCPFCGGTDISCADAGYKTDVWFVQCENCCATFPHFDSEAEAIEAWNRRTKIETNIYDKVETYPNCTVQVLTNTATGEVSVGWWENGGKEDGT